MEKEVDKRPLVIKELDMSISNIMFSLQRLEQSEAIEYLKGVAEFCIVRSNTYRRSEDVALKDSIKAAMNSFINKIAEDGRKEPTEERVGAEYILFCGKQVWIDLHNLRDEELAYKRGPSDCPEVHLDEHYFTQDDAVNAAKKQGKRLLTLDEMVYVANLQHRWDDEKKGMWITFEKVGGGAIDIFFPAAGYRGSSSGAFNYVGTNGYYWSTAVTGTNGYNLFFNSSSVYPASDNNRAMALPVRCVSE